MEEKRSFCWFVLALALSVAQVKASNFLRFQGTGITSNVANILGFGVDDMMQRCVSVPNALCVGGTNKIIMPKSVAPDLIGWWSFDGAYAVDESRNGNHLHPSVSAGPPSFGKGASGAFVGGSSATAKGSPSLKTPVSTVAFWMYLLEPASASPHNIFSKGFASSANPAILLHPNSHKITVNVATRAASNEGLTSMGAIPLRRWTHIAVTVAEDSLALYINGIEDAAVNLRGVPLANEGDLVVGAGAGRPGFEGYIDDLRYYKRPMAEAEIAGFSVPGLTGVVDHDFVRIGNHACKYAEAMAPTTCGPFHELCSLEELYETAFHVARVQGWLTLAKGVWFRDIEPEPLTTACTQGAEGASRVVL